MANKITIHPLYSSSSQNVNYDVSVIKLSTFVAQSSTIQYIQLYTGSVPLGTKMTIGGWGLTGSGNNPSNQLLTATVPTIDGSNCGFTSKI